MNVYSADILIHATVYVKAKDAAEATMIIAGLEGTCLTLSEQDDEELPISGLDYDNPDLPDVSLSPAMTVGAAELVDLVQGDEP
jgi:hypothetical protein